MHSRFYTYIQIYFNLITWPFFLQESCILLTYPNGYMQSHSCWLSPDSILSSTASSSYGSIYKVLTQQKPKHGIYFKYMHYYSADSGQLGWLLMANVCLKTKSNSEDVHNSMHHTTSSVQTRAKCQHWGEQQALGACSPWEQGCEENDEPWRSPWHPQGLHGSRKSTRILLKNTQI